MTFEEYLNNNGTLTYSTKGVSMLPMLRQDRDLVMLKKHSGARLKKYDVALYIRPPHDYVLHRIVEVRENDYVFLGDNCINKEYGITDSDIIAVMTDFVHNGKSVSADNKLYKAYYRLKVFFFPLRRIKHKLLTPLRKLKKMLLEPR